MRIGLAIFAFLVSTFTCVIGVGQRAHVTCERTPAGTVDCRVEDQIFGVMPVGEPIIVEDLNEARSDRVCEAYFDADGDMQQQCSWRLILDGADTIINISGFSRNAAQSTAEDLNAYLSTTEASFSQRATNSSLTFVMAGSSAVTALLGIVALASLRNRDETA